MPKILIVVLLFILTRKLYLNNKMLDEYIDYSNKQNQLIIHLKERLDDKSLKLDRRKELIDLLINDTKYKDFKIKEQTNINNKNLKAYLELNRNMKIIKNTKSSRIRNKHIKQFINKFQKQYENIKLSKVK